MTRKPQRNDVQFAVRLPAALVERVAAYREQLQSETPAFNISRADAFRVALIRGLDSLETDLHRPVGRKRS